ncbi:hypothetical protein V8B55DRAFT_1444359 [Mucor lusitanicus]|uniref:Uncharacterized protein n=2 Tax=Mucor circinelloides f. lusitanicus TaxID=29924 RepID=A0A168PGW1_MUCCL|nr:hypothetical protein FB192DRAFT_1374979 [Mucor lusitanicus]OAD07716.1 hypothetical protein MUCCIDRAFT_104658 [Mucor lusitanicus CBS 277.49]
MAAQIQPTTWNERLLQIELRAANEKLQMYQEQHGLPIQAVQPVAQPGVQQGNETLVRLEGIIQAQQKEITKLKAHLYYVENDFDAKLRQLDSEEDERLEFVEELTRDLDERLCGLEDEAIAAMQLKATDEKLADLHLDVVLTEEAESAALEYMSL